MLPRVAALLDVSQLSEVTEVKDESTFVRPMYAGNALSTVGSSDPIKVVTVRPTVFDKAAREGGVALKPAGLKALSSLRMEKAYVLAPRMSQQRTHAHGHAWARMGPSGRVGDGAAVTRGGGGHWTGGGGGRVWYSPLLAVRVHARAE